jgi:ADP-ribosyl-[dinitrogen reductase] hydrolase
MSVTREKIRGMFLGAFIGDTLGKPVETWTPDRIQQTYGRLAEIKDPSHHKWFTGQPAGTWTDDTQLTLAVAEGILKAGLDMDAQKEVHVAAMRESTDGWGGSTKHSVCRLANGAHWSKSGQAGSDVGKGTGAGNGVPMKVTPVGAWIAMQPEPGTVMTQALDFIADLSKMTHMTSISASAGMAMAVAAAYCLIHRPDSFDPIRFSSRLVAASTYGRLTLPETIGEDDLTHRLALCGHYQDYTPERIISDFGGGSCYCYHSVPFTMMFFLKGYNTVESLYDVVNGGGDTDSNGSMLGALLGALHGEGIFPAHLTDALNPDQKAIVLDVAERFYSKFGA